MIRRLIYRFHRWLDRFLLPESMWEQIYNEDFYKVR
jgi:hypothetical protein